MSTAKAQSTFEYIVQQFKDAMLFEEYLKASGMFQGAIASGEIDLEEIDDLSDEADKANEKINYWEKESSSLKLDWQGAIDNRD